MGLTLFPPPLSLRLVTNGAALWILPQIALRGAGAGGFWRALGMPALTAPGGLAAWEAAGRARA